MHFDNPKRQKELSKYRRFSPAPEQIKAFLDKHFEVKPRRNGEQLCIANPFNGDTGKHFGINAKTGMCHDWRGDEWAGPPDKKTGKRRRTFIHFVQLYLKCDYKSAIAAIVNCHPSPSIKYELAEPEVYEAPLVSLPSGSEPIWDSQHRLAANIVSNWLGTRGITDSLIKKYRLHHTGTDAVFPYYEYGVLSYWQTRSPLNKIFKFPDAKIYKLNKTDYLFGMDQSEQSSFIIITEAIIGAITIGSQCVATGGADLSTTQIKKLRTLSPTEIIVAPDNDAAGLNSVIENCRQLTNAGFKVRFSLPPALPYNDDDDRIKYTKDWNELYDKLRPRWSFDAIRDYCITNAINYNDSARFNILSIISSMKRKLIR